MSKTHLETMMSLHKNHDEGQSFIDFNHEEDKNELSHRKHIRQLLENKLEQKRLKKELEYFDGELDGDFEWGYLDK